MNIIFFSETSLRWPDWSTCWRYPRHHHRHQQRREDWWKGEINEDKIHETAFRMTTPQHAFILNQSNCKCLLRGDIKIIYDMFDFVSSAHWWASTQCVFDKWVSFRCVIFLLLVLKFTFVFFQRELIENDVSICGYANVNPSYTVMTYTDKIQKYI